MFAPAAPWRVLCGDAVDSPARWLWRVTGRKKLYVLVLTLTQAASGALAAAYALLLRGIVDSAVEKDAALFQRYVLALLCLTALQLSLAAVVRGLHERSRADVENTLKQRLFDALLRKDYASVSAVHTAEWLNRLTSDTALVADGVSEILPGLAGMAVRLLSALVMILWLDGWFAGILLPGGAALVALTWVFRRALKRLHKGIQESDGRLRAFLQERLGSLLVIRSYAAEEPVSAEAAEKMAAHKAARLRRSRFSNLANIGFGLAMRGMYLLGIVYCAHGILTGRVTYGTLTAVMQLIGQIQGPFANISGYLPRWYAMLASAERLLEAESFPDDGRTMDAGAIREYYEQRFRTLGLRKASFSYPDSLQGVRNLDLSISKGEYVALTGRSGGGKSTALKLLMCVYALDSGERYINDEPLTAAYRRLFAYVPQGNALMDGTIRQAVSLGAPSAAGDDDRIRRALRLACADEFVPALDAALGERGSGLSEGQRQRLAIARAIFADAPILLLDEATSALDADTEGRLLRNLRELTDKTVVIVTHRAAALSICDRSVRIEPLEGENP